LAGVLYAYLYGQLTEIGIDVAWESPLVGFPAISHRFRWRTGMMAILDTFSANKLAKRLLAMIISQSITAVAIRKIFPIDSVFPSKPSIVSIGP
jgi:hypothetical protein